MSDILIKGMEMPTSCCQCPVNMEICKRGYEYLLKHPELYDKRADDCPLIELPPHGDLIDKKTVSDNLASVLSKKNPPFSYPDWNDAIVAMLTAPTIIPAEEGET